MFDWDNSGIVYEGRRNWCRDATSDDNLSMGSGQLQSRKSMNTIVHLIRNVILLTAAIATPVICAAADADQSWTPEQIGWQCFPLKPDKTLAYKTVTGKDGAPIELKLQVFLPQGWQASDQRPAAVFFHGGGWHGGGPDHYYPQSRYLALRGMVAISVEYRTINRFGTSPKECVKDGKSAMRWVKAHAAELGIDPEADRGRRRICRRAYCRSHRAGACL